MDEHRLIICQQPRRGRMSGYSLRDRRPIDPPPIVQLVTRNGQIDHANAALLVVYASLWTADLSTVLSPSYIRSVSNHEPEVSPIDAMLPSPLNNYPPNIPPEHSHPTPNPTLFSDSSSRQGSSSTVADAPSRQGSLSTVADASSHQGSSSTVADAPSRTQSNPQTRLQNSFNLSSELQPSTGSEEPLDNASESSEQLPDLASSSSSSLAPPTTAAVSTGSTIQSRIVLGSLISSCYILKDPDSRLGMFFIFPDVAIRHSGTYRLRFDLFDLSMGDAFGHASNASFSSTKTEPQQGRTPEEGDRSSGRRKVEMKVGGGVPMVLASEVTPGEADVMVPVNETGSQSLASIVSDEFTVYNPKTFPGMSESTPYSICFARQGIRIHIRPIKDNQDPQ